MEEIRNYNAEQFSKSTSELMGNMNLVENLVLKAHVISEFVINCYLESKSVKNERNFFKENLSYANKLLILENYGTLPIANSEDVILSFKLLNKLRNQFAHTLVFNQNTFRDLIQSIRRISSDKLADTSSDDSIGSLKYIHNISFILSYLNGYLFGVYTVERDKKIRELTQHDDIITPVS